jgi:tripartite-type tricarboxylate transporter receptor subunit TctC
MLLAQAARSLRMRYPRPVRGALLTLISFMIAATAHAQQDWPSRPVTLVNPFTAGSAVDVVARIVSQRVSQNLNQQFNVENRTGASGNIGTEAAARAKPDGAVFLVGSPGTMAINPFLFQKLPYDAIKDFVAVSHLVSFPQVLVVNAKLPVKNLEELVAYVRERPGKLNFASSGSGSTSHLVMELIKADARLDIVHVPFRGGAPAIQAVIAGDVHLGVEGLPSLPAHLKAGTIRPLGVTSATRSPTLPQVPAIAELVPGFDATAWVILFAPAGTASAIVERFAAEAKRALEDEGVRAKLAEIGATVVSTGPRDTAAFQISASWQSSNARWKSREPKLNKPPGIP